MQSQKLALLALGGRTTLFYLRTINQCYQLKKGKKALCPLLLKKTDFAAINQLLPDQFNQLEGIVKTQLDSLSHFEKVIIPNITLHETVDRLSAHSYPIVHPLKAVIYRLVKDSHKKILLVGSQYTMSSSYLTSTFNSIGIEVVVPSTEDQELIDGCRTKIYDFSETNKDRDLFLQLISTYQQEYTVVIACTELSLILPSVSQGIYDMTRIQIDEAMKIFDL